MNKVSNVLRVCAAIVALLGAGTFSSNAHDLRNRPKATAYSIARDASSHSIACGGKATCTVPLTVGTGAHNFIWLVANCTGCNLTSVVDRTNGAKLSCKTATDGAPDYVKTFTCWTVGVPSGSNSFLIRLSGAPRTSKFRACASSYTGVNQLSPFDVFPTVYTALGRAASISESITTKLPNDWIIDAVSLLVGSQTNPLVSGNSDKGPIPIPSTYRDNWSYPTTATWATLSVAALRAG